MSLYIVSTLSSMAATEKNATINLAAELSQEKEYGPAAIEYRRLALHSPDPSDRAGYFWASAYQYLHLNHHERLMSMLDRCEDNRPDLEASCSLLRAASAMQSTTTDEAGFYLESLMTPSRTKDVRQWAGRHRAAQWIRDGNAAAARKTLVAATGSNEAGLAAISDYDAGKDKRPWFGGLLGLIPGLGHAYAGEYANGLRALILNSFFIYGLVESAEQENWGIFTPIAFFELTWYTGSIYGGIDASHRFNRSRRDAAMLKIAGRTSFSPDLKQIPVISLQFEF
jgi:hypothetical protein